VLWWFVPDEAFPLILIVGALCVIVRFVRPARVVGWLLPFLLLPLLVHVLDVAFEMLPGWMVAAIIAAVLISIARGLIALVVGERAAEGLWTGIALLKEQTEAVVALFW
jgi:hypothetical protein